MSIGEAFTLAGFVIFTIVLALRRWEPRVPIGIALALLIVTAITQAVGSEAIAERLAEYAFYSLVSGVVLVLIRQARHGPEEDQGEEDGKGDLSDRC